jgi:hypothetical protein
MNRRELLKLYIDADQKHNKNQLSDLEHIRIMTNIHSNIGQVKPTLLAHPAMLAVFPLIPLNWVYQKCYDKLYLKPHIKKIIQSYANK